MRFSQLNIPVSSLAECKSCNRLGFAVLGFALAKLRLAMLCLCDALPSRAFALRYPAVIAMPLLCIAPLRHAFALHTYAVPWLCYAILCRGLALTCCAFAMACVQRIAVTLPFLAPLCLRHATAGWAIALH